MYLNPQIHDTQDTLTIHVGYIGIPSRIRISSSTFGRAWMRAGNFRYMYLKSHHVSRMYPACILITLAQIHVSCMYPAQLYPASQNSDTYMYLSTEDTPP